MWHIVAAKATEQKIPRLAAEKDFEKKMRKTLRQNYEIT